MLYLFYNKIFNLNRLFLHFLAFLYFSFFFFFQLMSKHYLPFTLKKGFYKGTLHIRKCPLWHFGKFVKTVGYDEFVGIIKYTGGNYNEIII